MLVNVCAEVIPGCKLNLALPRSSSSSLIRFLDVAAQWFQRAREELCADATLAARSNVSKSGPMPTAAVSQGPQSSPEAVTTSTFRVEEAAVFSPATSQWVAVTTGDQLYDGCQVYLFQPTALAQSIGITDSVGLLPEPVGPEVFFRDCIDAPAAASPPRRPSVLPSPTAVRGPTPTSSLPREVAVRLSMERPIGDRCDNDNDNGGGDGVTVTQFLVTEAAPPSPAPVLLRAASSMTAAAEDSHFRSRRPSPPRQPLLRQLQGQLPPSTPSSPDRPRTTSTAAASAVVAAPALDPYTVLDELFGLLDTDRDGAISLSQLRNAMVLHGVDPNSVAPSFDHGDRTVSKAVFLHFVNRYYRVALELLDRMRSSLSAAQLQQQQQPSPSRVQYQQTEWVGSSAVHGDETRSAAARLRQHQLEDVLRQESELLLQLEALRKVKRFLLASEPHPQDSEDDAGSTRIVPRVATSPTNHRSPLRERGIPSVKSTPPSASRRVAA